MTSNTRTPVEAATRFFWGWLTAGTAASILGNVTHALLDPHAGSPVIAAAVAVVPPVVLLGATHGVHALVQSRIVGAAYRAALAICVAVVLSAFVLSFAALRELAIVWAGVHPSIAWLVPLVVDLSITGSTIALLALTSAQRDEVLDADVHAVAQPEVEYDDDVLQGARMYAQARDERRNAVQPVHTPAQGVSVADLIAREAAQTVTQASLDVDTSTDPALFAVHAVAAERIVQDGVTRIDRVKVAEVLAEHAHGTAPSMIARKLSVGYSTVVRILEHHTAQAETVEVSA